jgi:hypothetical protein
MKGKELNRIIAGALVLFSAVIGGCGGLAQQDTGLLLSVDWEEGQTLRYKFVSERNMTVDWGQMGKKDAQPASKLAEYTESLEMVMAYTPLEIDPYGLTTIKAECESVRTYRMYEGASGTRGQDAANSMAKKSFTLKVAPNGRIEDRSGLRKFLYEAGENSFRQTSAGRVKDPDMIADVLASQWFLWDAVSSIAKAASGVNVGDTWQSVVSVPTPMILKEGRTVTYELAEVRDANDGKIAVIKSTYALAPHEEFPWPVPYQGSFLPGRTFGFLQSYKVEELSGSGEELFNVTKGRIESYSQNYDTKMTAGLMFRLPGRVPIDIKQKLTMELLDE